MGALRLPALAGVLGLGLLAASCSSSPSKSATSTSTTLHQRTTTTTTTTPPPTSTTTSTTSTTACTTVSAAAGATQGAAGTIIGTITLSVATSEPCTIMGYPTMALFASGGTALPVTMMDGLTINDPGPATQPATLVTLSPTQKAEFTYQYSDVTTGNETSCASSATASVTTPGAKAASTPIPFSAAPCANGTIHVSPVYAATAGG
jgi:hypothetical protein